MYLTSLLGVSFLSATFALQVPYRISQKVSYPFQLLNGTSIVEDVSRQDELDGPKIHPGVNATTFDWQDTPKWYFDAVSTDSKNESISVVFYNLGPESFSAPFLGGPLTLEISGTFDNGTQFMTASPAPDGAVVESGTKGIKGEWKGSGSSFTGSALSDSSPEYTVSINNLALGIFGKMTLKSVSPPHYPCDVNKPDVSQEIIPNIYWANAVPDAIAVVDFTINGKALKFKGVGYHDKNWGAAALEPSVRSWYWGHGRLGPYSLVWFDTVTPDGKEHFSSWITKDGKVVSKRCEPNSIVVRPWGENNDFPPVRGAPAPSGYTLRYDLGEDGTFVANFTREVDQLDNDIYKRMIGPIVGGIEGGEQYEGRSLCEQFQF